jgi:hypothetical protein
MFMKFSILAAIAAIVAIAFPAFAGFDQYTGKRYTTLMAPTPLGVTQTGATTNMVTLDGAVTNAQNVVQTIGAITNSVTTGVDCVGLVGRGAVVFTLAPGVGGILSATISTCATTNGTYVTVTNDQGQATWSVTNTAAYRVVPVRPNAFNRYWRVNVTATGVTNGVAGAVLVTE